MVFVVACTQPSRWCLMLSWSAFQRKNMFMKSASEMSFSTNSTPSFPPITIYSCAAEFTIIGSPLNYEASKPMRSFMLCNLHLNVTYFTNEFHNLQRPIPFKSLNVTEVVKYFQNTSPTISPLSPTQANIITTNPHLQIHLHKIE